MAEILVKGSVVTVESQGLLALQAMFREAPTITAANFRDYTGRVLGAFRRDFVATLSAKKKKLVEGGGKRKPGIVYRAYPNPRATSKQEKRQAVDGKGLGAVEGVITIVKQSTILHERGGTIRPKAARLLAIPLGVWRNPNKRQAELGGLAPKDIPRHRLFTKKRRRKGNGQLVLFTTLNKGGKTKTSAVFVLKRSVTMPASLGAERFWLGYEAQRRTRLFEMLATTRNEIIEDFRKRLQRFVSKIA